MKIAEFMPSAKPELGDRIEQALLSAAEAKSLALTAEKLAKRVFSACYLAETGPVQEREHKARTALKYVAAEDDWLAKEGAANLRQAEADALHVRFETYRTKEATRRAEMNLR